MQYEKGLGIIRGPFRFQDKIKSRSVTRTAVAHFEVSSEEKVLPASSTLTKILDEANKYNSYSAFFANPLLDAELRFTDHFIILKHNVDLTRKGRIGPGLPPIHDGFYIREA